MQPPTTFKRGFSFSLYLRFHLQTPKIDRPRRWKLHQKLAKRKRRTNRAFSLRVAYMVANGFRRRWQRGCWKSWWNTITATKATPNGKSFDRLIGTFCPLQIPMATNTVWITIECGGKLDPDIQTIDRRCLHWRKWNTRLSNIQAGIFNERFLFTAWSGWNETNKMSCQVAMELIRVGISIWNGVALAVRHRRAAISMLARKHSLNRRRKHFHHFYWIIRSR